MAGDEWLTVEEIAGRVKVTVETVRRWLRAGRLQGVRISDKAGWRVKASEVDRFMGALSGGPTLGAEPRDPQGGTMTGTERGREG